MQRQASALQGLFRAGARDSSLSTWVNAHSTVRLNPPGPSRPLRRACGRGRLIPSLLPSLESQPAARPRAPTRQSCSAACLWSRSSLLIFSQRASTKPASCSWAWARCGAALKSLILHPIPCRHRATHHGAAFQHGDLTYAGRRTSLFYSRHPQKQLNSAGRANLRQHWLPCRNLFT